MKNEFQNLRKALKQKSSKEQANILQRFFKTGPGEYGEGDIFIGLKVPQIRETVKEFSEIRLGDIQKLVSSNIHEERLTGLLILVSQYKKGSEAEKEKIFKFYLRNTKNMNNWDLIDLTAEHIVGAFLSERDRSILFNLAQSTSLWERRISMLSCFHYIKQNSFETALQVAQILLNDRHDLIHKAVGWMLREIGKRNLQVEETFLKKYYKQMPRTMLRYAIEKFPDRKRLAYLKGKI
ncbi:MAG: DNA alkylation repair protein [Bacteroidetes bacterium]|nr:DNA alkylation repair protein [Bacteroidota bacterium]MBU2585750.1 DNA alkylation repair protein [Bacteroidota bacterium]